MPRWLPPYLHGLFATTPQEGWSAGGQGPASDVARHRREPHARFERGDVRERARSSSPAAPIGTAPSVRTETPGPLICTVVGDVVRAGFGEIEPGTSLRAVIDRLGGGPRPGRPIKAVLSGFSNPVLTAADLDAPVSYEGLSAAGSGLGSAGFIVFDDTRSMLAVARMVSRFLYVESCGQCRACKQGCGEVTRHLDTLATGQGEIGDVDVIARRLRNVTDQNRCFLGEQEQRVISSLLRTFPEDFVAEIEHPAELDRLPLPKIVDIRDGVATYDDRCDAQAPRLDLRVLTAGQRSTR